MTGEEQLEGRRKDEGRLQTNGDLCKDGFVFAVTVKPLLPGDLHTRLSAHLRPEFHQWGRLIRIKS